MWTTKQPEPTPVEREITLCDGRLILRVSPSQGDPKRLYQSFNLWFGEHSNATDSCDTCLQEWPREALTRARHMLNELESKIHEEGL